MKLDISEIESIVEGVIEDFAKEQPYKVVCTTCRGELSIEKTEVDSDTDMTVIVEPCQACITDAVTNALEKSGGE